LTVHLSASALIPIEVDNMRTTESALALSVTEFCDAHRISRATFYNMVRLGIAPRVMTVGARKLISVEAAAQWRRAREAAAEAEVAA
jgi:predicted DNA-binding transcriptional regulator AlpA